MARYSNVKKAFLAMKDLGIDEAKVKPVLKKLLRTFDKNWDFIAEDNFRVLADAIFEEEEAQAIQEKKGKKKMVEEEETGAGEVRKGKKKAPEPTPDPEEDEESMTEPERPLKRQRRRGEGGSALTLNNTSPNLDRPVLIEPKVEIGETLPLTSPAPPLPSEQVIVPAKQKSPGAPSLIIPKDEPFTDDMPLTAICPDSVDKGNSSVPLAERGEVNGHSEEQNGEAEGNVDGAPPSAVEKPTEHKQVAIQEESSAMEVASSPLGEVKISLSFTPATEGQNLRIPSLDELRRAMEEKCLRSYKILDPNFSVLNLMSDMCSCYLELAANLPKQSPEPEHVPYITTNLDMLKKSAATDAVFPAVTEGNIYATQGTENGVVCSGSKPSKDASVAQGDEVKNPKDADFSDSQGLVVVPECQISVDDWRSIHNCNNITQGEEAVEISWANEVNNELPPPFRYIPQSLVFEGAAVKFSLSNITEDQCCFSCFGDCLAASATPCACASAVGGFAYTLEGLLKEDFLEECISMARDILKLCVQTCKKCPLEKAKKDEILEPCKGHLKRKVIKECWSKCGCNKNCGNRVVQRGIHSKLQVFFMPNGKGWGLRTLEKLPKGAFVCEYAGEILTIMELYERVSEKCTSPVILDAYWGSEEVPGDDKALCLDARHYGNVARFINHRCLDANLIEVPVQVETSDHHYYHLAFFTTREIDAMEELTWDYGIDFNCHDHPMKMFRCLCGSSFCRDKASKKS